jgi:hypothetical protein
LKKLKIIIKTEYMSANQCLECIKLLLKFKILLFFFLVINSAKGQEFNELANNPLTEYNQLELAEKYFNVPIYNISIKGVNIPIALNYDASGYRYKKQTRGIGLNWNIYAGPKIDKIINSMDDTDTDGWYTLGSEPSSTFYDDYIGETDGSPTEAPDLCRDEYEFSINGENACFVLKAGSTYPQMIYGHNFKVRIQDLLKPFSENPNYIREGTAINITDENGVVYKFIEGDIEWTEPTIQTNFWWPCTFYESAGGFGYFYSDEVANNSNMLMSPTIKNYIISKIYNPNGETISFEYDIDINAWRDYTSNVYTYYDNSSYFREDYTIKVLYNKVISKISTSKEIVFFDYDIEDDNYWISQLNPPNLIDEEPKLLSQIRITDAQTNDLLSTYKFEHGNYQGNAKSRLDNIYQVSGNGEATLYRSFEYYPGSLPGPSSEHLSVDLFGFFNGVEAGDNSHTIPIQNPVTDVANRYYNLNAMKISTLKSIIYPTEGKIELDYSVKAGQSRYGGGLVVDHITQYDNDGSELSTINFKYSYLEGYIIDEELLENYYYTAFNEYKIYSSDVLKTFDGFSNYKSTQPVEGSFPYISDAFDISYRPHKGSFFREIEIVKNTGEYGKIKCEYEPALNNTSMAGVIKDITYLDKSLNPVKKVSYNRSYQKYGTPLKGINIIGKNYVWNGSASVTSKTGELREFCHTTFELDSKIIEEYRDGITSKNEFLFTYNADGVIKTKEFTNSIGDTYIVETTTTKDLICDPGDLWDYYLLRPIERTYWLKGTTKNRLLKAELNFYNQEGNLTSDYVYLTEKPIDENNFSRAHRDCGGYDERLIFDPNYVLNKRINYDQGGYVESIYKEKQQDRSYFYGYGTQRYLIAELNNLNGDEVAYTSFEVYDGQLVKENLTSSYVSYANSPEDAITGNYYGILRGSTQIVLKDSDLELTVIDKNLAVEPNLIELEDPDENALVIDIPLPGGRITISNLHYENRVGYTVSFWAKAIASGATLNLNDEVINIDYDSDWKYYETRINNVESLVIQNNSSVSTYMDELRVYPSNAMMNTYTYKPYYGITSSCDINNNIINNVYDSHGRVIMVKDQDKNVIAIYNYNILGELESGTVGINDYLNTDSPNQINFGTTSGSHVVNIISNISWSVSKSQTWLSISRTSGTGNNNLTISASSWSGAPRLGYVYISGGGIVQKILITQGDNDMNP